MSLTKSLFEASGVTVATALAIVGVFCEPVQMRVVSCGAAQPNVGGTVCLFQRLATVAVGVARVQRDRVCPIWRTVLAWEGSSATLNDARVSRASDNGLAAWQVSQGRFRKRSKLERG